MLGKSKIGGIILLVALGLMLGAVIILATGSAVADTVEITITSNPAGPGYVIVDGAAIETPTTITTWEQGTEHTLVAVLSVPGVTGEQYSFNHWEDDTYLTDTLTYAYTVTDLTAAFTAVFDHQYQLTMAANVGTTSPGVGNSWHNEGTEITITGMAPSASANDKFVSLIWDGQGSGSYDGALNPTTVTMNGPIIETATWTHQYLVSFAVSPAGGGTTTPSGTDDWKDEGSLSIQATPSAGYTFASWSSNNGDITFGSSTTAATTAQIGGPGTITANFVQNLVQIIITSSPIGEGYVIVDGAETETPHTFNWVPGSSHSLEALSPVTAGTGERYSFTSWTDSGNQIHSYTVGAAASVTASFAHQYSVTMATNGGTTTPTVGTHWYNAGTHLTLEVTEPAADEGARYTWNGWAGSGSGNYDGMDNPATNAVTVNGPITETADWNLQYQLTMINAAGTTSPVTGSWYDAGDHVTITANHPTTVAGERYQFVSWSGTGTGSYDGTDNPASNAVTMNGPITETATWTHQYQLTIDSSDGTVEPSTGTWYNAGSQVTITANHPTTVTGEQYLFVSWSGTGTGSYDGTDNPASNAVTMNGPITEYASWNHQYRLSMVSNAGTTSPETGSWYNAGSQVTITATHPTEIAGERYQFTSWSGTGTGSYDGTSNPASNAVTMNAPITETATWVHQYQVSFAVSPPGGGTVTPAGEDVWENAGSLSIQAAPLSGYAFESWSSSNPTKITFDAQSASTEATIEGPGTITATFSLLPVGVTITSSPTGPSYVLVDNDAFSTPHTFTWLPGESHTLEAAASVDISGNERYLFTSWSDSGGRVHSYTVTSSTATITASYAHQYLVTLATNGGTTTPAVGTHWYSVGSQVTLDATAPTAGTTIRYEWNGWAGSGTGSYTGTNRPATNAVTVNGPITETASWTTQYLVSFISSPSAGGTTSPSGLVWEDAGPLSIQAVPDDGYAFTSWDSDTASITFNAQAASTTANINGPGTITAAFTLQPVTVTITSSPSGTGYVLVDGVATSTPHAFSWLPGSIHSLEALSTVTVGTGERYSFTSWSDSGSRVHSYTVTSTATVTATFAHQYLVTMATDGGTTTPAVGSYWYNVGSTVTLDAAAPASGTGYRFVWNSWSGTGTGSYSGTTKLATNAVTVNGPITETANWTRQYQVSFAVTPAGGGTTAPAGTNIWYDAGDVITIQATPATNYAFSTWTSGSTSLTFGAQTAMTTAFIGGPGTITANFVLALGITITSSPTGAGYVLVDGSPITTPANFKWTIGAVHSIQAVQTVGTSGERYAFSSWSDGGARIHSYTVTALTATVIADFDHQYLLSMAADVGTTTPAAGGTGTWQNAGSKVAINAAAPSVASAYERYHWVGWTGSGSGNYTGAGASPAANVTMNGPITETASWIHQYLVNITTNFGTTDPIAGELWVVEGSSIVLNATAPAAGAGERYIFNGWTGSGTGSYTGMENPVTGAIQITGPLNQTASWTRQQVPYAPIGLTANSGDGLVNLNWTAPADGGLAIDYYVVYQDGVRVGTVTTLNTTITGLTNERTYTFMVAAHNAIGNGPNSSTVMIKPLRNPSILALAITSPEAGSYDRTGGVLLQWTVTDLSSTIVKTEVSRDGKAWRTVSGTSQLMGGLPDGNVTLSVRVADAANNVLTRSVLIMVDVTEPTVTITSPAAWAMLGSQTVTVAWSVIDQVSGLDRVELSVDGTNWTAQTGSSASLLFGDGEAQVFIRATDRAGNYVTASVPFTVDTLAPVLMTRSPTGAGESTLISVMVTFDEAMDRSLSTVSITGVQGNLQWAGDNLIFTPSQALTGITTYTIFVRGFDLAGNTVEESWMFQTAMVGKISGILYGHDGKPLPNTVVRLIGGPTAARTGMGQIGLAASTAIDTVRETTSDAKGAFTFYDVAIGSYALEFTEVGYLAKSMGVTMTADAVTSGGLTVEPGALHPDPGNGLLLILVVGGTCAAMVGAIILIRRRRA